MSKFFYIRSYFLLMCLALFYSCGHILSGKYVYIQDKNVDLEALAKTHRVPPALILNYNQKKPLKVGQWVFVPLNHGLMNQFSSEKKFYHYTDSEEFYKTPFLWPVPGQERVSSNYGRRRGRPHEGVDIPAPEGTDIVAAESGKVIYSDNRIEGYGNMTVISHANGTFTVYAHAKQNFKKVNDNVFRGEIIAKVGSTGRSTGPHLHFEVRQGPKTVDPYKLIKPHP